MHMDVFAFNLFIKSVVCCDNLLFPHIGAVLTLLSWIKSEGGITTNLLFSHFSGRQI
jgi:hypothetical protein